jgi:hypothetical protein
VTSRTWKVLWGVLLFLVLYVVLVERPFVDDVRGPSNRKALLLRDFDPAQATSIEIRSGGRTSRLEKDGGSWVVASDGRFPADAKAVADLLARADTVQAGPIVSENKEKQGTFGVDSTGVEVRILGGAAELAHFWVGKSTPDFSGLFVRLEGSNDVHGIPGWNKFAFDRENQTWRERKLVPFDPESVQKLTVAFADSVLTFTRQGNDSLKTSAWTVLGNHPGQPEAPAIAEAVRPLVQAATNLMADAFPAPTDTIPTVWEPLAMRIEVEARGGDRVTVEFGPKNATDQYYVRRSGQNAVALVGTWRLARFRKHYPDMLKPLGAGAPPDATAPPGAARTTTG